MLASLIEYLKTLNNFKKGLFNLYTLRKKLLVPSEFYLAEINESPDNLQRNIYLIKINRFTWN